MSYKTIGSEAIMNLCLAAAVVMRKREYGEGSYREETEP